MNDAEKQKILEELEGIPEDLYDEFVRDVIMQTREKILKLRESLSNSDYDNIADIAHFIKGSSGNMRLYTIHNLAKSIEASSREKNTDDIANDLKELEKAVGQIQKQFQK